MGIVRIQFADDLKPSLLTILREKLVIDAEISDDDLYARWMHYVVETLRIYFDLKSGKLNHEQIGESWIFVESEWATTCHKMLGYQVLLQKWDSGFPYEDDDVPRRIQGSPHWLRRVIVVVWRPVGFSLQ